MVVAEEEKAAAFASTLSCVENLLAIQARTETQFEGEQVDIIRFHQLREQLPAVERDRKVCLDNLRPGLRYRLAMNHATDLTLAALAHIRGDREASAEGFFDMLLTVFGLPRVEFFDLDLSHPQSDVKPILTVSQLMLHVFFEGLLAVIFIRIRVV